MTAQFNLLEQFYRTSEKITNQKSKAFSKLLHDSSFIGLRGTRSVPTEPSRETPSDLSRYKSRYACSAGINSD